MPGVRMLALLFVLVLIAAAACGDSEDSTATAAAPEATTTQPPATTRPPATTQAPTTSVAPTTTAAPEQESVSDEQLAAAAAVGDIAAGEELFHEPVDGVPHSLACSSCHTLDGKDRSDGPTLAGISAVAADRVDGMSDVDYLAQSIVDPYAFQVGGDWTFAMPYQYPDALSEDEINNLVAFLLTR